MTDPRPIVAATLHILAEWGRDSLRHIADQVERLEQDAACCPVCECEEATCDEDCPLENWRQW